uniref:Putative cytochrome n=1 Tax=Corethrella appendiculata TaxID=1370023 RepID=U5EUU8_9DIPT
METLNAILLVLISIILLIYLYLRHTYSYWKSRNFPFVEPALLYGNMKGFGKVHQAFIIQELYKKFRAGGYKVAGMYFLILKTVLIIDPEVIKNVLVKDFNYFHDRGMYNDEKSDPLSAHLFSIGGQQWRNLRAKLSPTFTSGKMKLMFNTIIDIAKDLDKTLHKNYSDKHCEIEVKDILARFTTDVIGTCAFGIDLNTLENPESEFRKKSVLAFQLTIWQNIRFIVISIFENISKKIGAKVTHPVVEEFFMRITRETVDYREKNNVQRNDFMNLLLEIKNNEKDPEQSITFNELAAQCFIFFLAGFETSSSTMSFCLYELALNEDVQEKLRDEINAAIEKNDGKITYELISSITYLDNVINETLRKYPPVDNLFRTTNKDYAIPGTDLTIEKGTMVMVPSFALHRDPEYFPDPERFNPDRFLPENGIRPYTFLPFGEGPRNCIGSRFGMMQTRIGLITVLRSFKMSPSKNTQIPLQIAADASILAAVGGIYLNFEKIE